MILWKDEYLDGVLRVLTLCLMLSDITKLDTYLKKITEKKELALVMNTHGASETRK